MMYQFEQFGVFVSLALFATHAYFWFNSYQCAYAVYAFDGSGIVHCEQGYVQLSNPPAMFEQTWKPYKEEVYPEYNITHWMADDLKEFPHVSVLGTHAVIKVYEFGEFWEFYWPCWMIAVATLLWPMRWVLHARRYWRNRHRRAKGHCVGCGYDLRGTQRACPECGLLFA